MWEKVESGGKDNGDRKWNTKRRKEVVRLERKKVERERLWKRGKRSVWLRQDGWQTERQEEVINI